MYWSQMSAELEDLISACDTCNVYSNDQAREPLMSHEVPKLPRQKPGADSFEMKGKRYLLLVDYHSKHFEFDLLENTHSSTIVQYFKNHFAKHGILQTIQSDNDPQFTAVESKEFCRSYGIAHTTSTPYHPKSNALQKKVYRQ